MSDHFKRLGFESPGKGQNMPTSSIRRRRDDPVRDSLGPILSLTFKTWSRILPALLRLTIFGFAPLWLVWGMIAISVQPFVEAQFRSELLGLVGIAALTASWIAMHQVFAACVVPSVLGTHGRLDNRTISTRPPLARCFLSLVGISTICGIATFIGLVAGVLPGLVIATTWLFASSVITIEGGSIRRALTRSRQLTAGRRLRTAILLSVFTVAIWVLAVWISVALLFAAPSSSFEALMAITVSFVIGFVGSILDVHIAVSYLAATDRVDGSTKSEIMRVFE